MSCNTPDKIVITLSGLIAWKLAPTAAISICADSRLDDGSEVLLEGIRALPALLFEILIDRVPNIGGGLLTSRRI